MDLCTPESIDPPKNVLVVHPNDETSEACECLSHPSNEIAKLEVSFSGDLPHRPTDETGPSKFGVISVGDMLRAARVDSEPDFTAPVTVDAIEDPTDLSAIGVAISRFCEYWGSGPEQLVVCFDSLDGLLRGSDPKTVFEFCYMLNKRFSSVDALAHFHLDPTRHEDRIVATLGSIFDEVVADDVSTDPTPEATDEDVARVLDEWDRETESGLTSPNGPFTEATDEDVARLFSE